MCVVFVCWFLVCVGCVFVLVVIGWLVLVVYCFGKVWCWWRFVGLIGGCCWIWECLVLGCCLFVEIVVEEVCVQVVKQVGFDMVVVWVVDLVVECQVGREKNEQEQVDMLQFVYGVFYERGLRVQVLCWVILV